MEPVLQKIRLLLDLCLDQTLGCCDVVLESWPVLPTKMSPNRGAFTSQTAASDQSPNLVRTPGGHLFLLKC